MIFIPESAIEDELSRYENLELFQNDWEVFQELQPVLAYFISVERLELLKDEEISLLEFMTVVVCKACSSMINKEIKIDVKTLDHYEEVNWEIWNNHITQSPTKAFDAFFHEYEQEDLLAFVEDSVQNDEENMVTGAGMELISVTMKSIIDSIHALN
ncbi:MAG: hypothetical protein WAT79_07305 [Saprospiraceae bacterium]